MDGSSLGGLNEEMLPARERLDLEKGNGKHGWVNNQKLEAIGELMEDLDRKEGNRREERENGFEEEEKDKVLGQVHRASERDSEGGNWDSEGRTKRSSGEVEKKERKKAKLSLGFKPEEEDDEKPSDGYEEEPRIQQASRRDRKSAGKAIAQALDRMSATAQSIQKTKTEEAVEKLQKEYESVFSTEDLVKGFCLMQNVVKASVFASLQAGSARDMWLQNASRET